MCRLGKVLWTWKGYGMRMMLKVASGAVALTLMCVGAFTMCDARELHRESGLMSKAEVRRSALATTEAVVTGRIGKAGASLLSGLASWYGEVWQGRTTASGEVFDQTQMTACHRTLPFGTLVRVINLRNHRSVVVKINDRGNLRPQRVIDLSSAAAEKIGLLQAGLAPVRLEIVSMAVAQHS